MQNNLNQNNLNLLIDIEVAYAGSNEAAKQSILKLQVVNGINIKQAIDASSILSKHLEIDLQTNKVGIFGNIKTLSTVVKNGDRIEIYRKLYLEPNESRLQRAKNLGNKDR